jgi:hypothetical protein
MRAISVIGGIALLSVAFATSAAAAPSDPFIGHWTSTDTDGSQQMLSFGGGGSTRMVSYFDDGASVCGWEAGGIPISATIHTTGSIDGDTLTSSETIGRCSTGGTFPVGEATYTYNSADNTLLDSFGVTWNR